MAEQKEAFKKYTPSLHTVRRIVIKDNIEKLGALYRPYMDLFEMSRVARYDCNDPSNCNYGQAEDYLNDIKTEYSKLVSLPS
jgi:hypothetical protein